RNLPFCLRVCRDILIITDGEVLIFIAFRTLMYQGITIMKFAQLGNLLNHDRHYISCNEKNRNSE
ncbi:hypothetical protein, partial [Vagococcus silagei]